MANPPIEHWQQLFGRLLVASVVGIAVLMWPVLSFGKLLTLLALIAAVDVVFVFLRAAWRHRHRSTA